MNGRGSWVGNGSPYSEERFFAYSRPSITGFSDSIVLYSILKCQLCRLDMQSGPYDEHLFFFKAAFWLYRNCSVPSLFLATRWGYLPLKETSHKIEPGLRATTQISMGSQVTVL